MGHKKWHKEAIEGQEKKFITHQFDAQWSKKYENGLQKSKEKKNDFEFYRENEAINILLSWEEKAFTEIKSARNFGIFN